MNFAAAVKSLFGVFFLSSPILIEFSFNCEARYWPVEITLRYSKINAACITVQGLTKLHNQICILCLAPQKILYVHRSDSQFQLLKSVEMYELTNANENSHDLVASVQDNCLYIYENNCQQSGKNCVWKMNLDNGQHARLFDVASPNEIRTMSLSNSGNILLLQHETVSTSRLYEYDRTSGKLIKNYTLPDSVVECGYVLQKPNGSYVISHKSKANPLSVACLSEFSADEQNNRLNFVTTYDLGTAMKQKAATITYVQPYSGDRYLVACGKSSMIVWVDLKEGNYDDVAQIAIQQRQNNYLAFIERIFFDFAQHQLLVSSNHTLQFPEAQVQAYSA